MRRSILSVFSMVMLFASTVFGEVASAKTKEEVAAKQIAAVKQKVNKIGVGEQAAIVVRLKGQDAAIRGYVSEIGEDGFTVTDVENLKTTKVVWQNVVSVHGKKVSVGLKIALIAGVVVGLIGMIGAVTGGFSN